MSSPELPSSSHLILDSRLVQRDSWQGEISQRRQIGETALSNIIDPLSVLNVWDESRTIEIVSNIALAQAKTKDEAISMVNRIEEVIDSCSPYLIEDSISQLSTEQIDEEAQLAAAHLGLISDTFIKEMIDARDISSSHQALIEIWPTFKETFLDGIEKGIAEGYIPADVISRLGPGLTKTSVRIADAAVLWAFGAISAYYSDEYDEIGVRHDVTKAGEKYIDNLAHEFIHKISGGTFISPDKGSTKYSRARVGYSTSSTIPEDINKIGINEAVTQHLALGVLTGDFETVSPEKRDDGDKIYKEYRKILATFIDRSMGLVNLKTITNGFFEDSGPKGSTELRRKLVRETKNAYGAGALNKLDKLMELSDIVKAEKFDEIILSRIHPPKLDASHNIIEKGYIDTSNLPTFYDLYK
jgi:hypothetical protein